MKTLTKQIAALASGAMVALNLATPTLISAWGDNSANGRRSYTIDQINHGVLGDKIVFNSISDSVDGDEKNFVSAKLSSEDPQTTWQGNNIAVKHGELYTIRLYVHNNNPGGYNAVAEDTHVYFSIPQYSATTVQVNGYIESSNASPSEYWDYVNFNSDQAFHLEYVYGSALLYNNNIGLHGLKLSDAIVTEATKGGVMIGYDALDGRVPGCYQFDNYVTVQVRAVYDTDYTIKKDVRLVGTKQWANYVNANVGDQVEFQIEYKNTSGKGLTQNNVMIKDILPSNLRYVPGTTKLWNSNNSGAIVNPDGSIFTSGINIGHYAPQANAFIRFTAEVVDTNLACGSNTMVNWAQGGVGNITIQDYASVITQKSCPAPVAEQEYHVTVRYVYEDGSEAYPTYSGVFLSGDPFRVEVPAITGYTPDKSLVTGVVENSDITITVTYKKDVIPEPEKPEPETPDPGPVTPKPVTKLPTTGPSEIASAILGLGSIGTAATYYVMTKKRNF